MSPPLRYHQELLGLEGAEADAKDSGVEECADEDWGDVLWDLHDEQEQCEAFQQACCTSSPLGLQKVSPSSPSIFSSREKSMLSSSSSSS